MELVLEVLLSHLAYFRQKGQSFKKSKVVVLNLQFSKDKLGIRRLLQRRILLEKNLR